MNIHNKRASKHKAKTSGTEGRTDKSTIALGDFSIILSVIDTTVDRQSVRINTTINHVDLIDLNRIFYLTTTEYTFFSNLHGSFNKSILVNKANFFKLKRSKVCSVTIRKVSNHA